MRLSRLLLPRPSSSSLSLPLSSLLVRRCVYSSGATRRIDSADSGADRERVRASAKSQEKEEKQQKETREEKKEEWGRRGGAHPGTTWTAVALGGLAFTLTVALTEEQRTGHTKPRVVILGSGWAAVGVLKMIDTNKFDVEVVSPRNYFLFTPLLPSATVGTLEGRSLVESMRKLCLGKGIRYTCAKATNINPEDHTVEVESAGTKESEKFAIPYDKLILAIGSQNSTFGVKGVEQNCHFLKTVEDASRLRKDIMVLFEEANLSHRTDEQRKDLLSFVIVGGGPTGVEFAAELNDFLREDLVKLFPHLEKYVSITIIQSGDHILNTYDQSISEYAERLLRKRHVNVLVQQRVLEVNDKAILFKDKPTGEDKSLKYGLCLWSTGVSPQSLALDLSNKLELQTNKRALVTDPYCRVIGAGGDIFAVGDCATIGLPKILDAAVEIFKMADENGSNDLDIDEFTLMAAWTVKKYPQLRHHFSHIAELFHKYDADKNGRISEDEFRVLLFDVDNSLKALPATAQVAAQQGTYVGKMFNSLATVQKDGIVSMQGTEDHDPFVYRHFGSTAYLGSDTAAFDTKRWKLNGVFAFYLWKSAYLSKQVSFRTRMLLFVEWMRKFLFGRDVSEF